MNESQFYVQWKGTEVCLDFWCECGATGHVDGGFVYALKCGGCGAEYDLPDTFSLRRVDEASHEPVTVSPDPS